MFGLLQGRILARLSVLGSFLCLGLGFSAIGNFGCLILVFACLGGRFGDFDVLVCWLSGLL